MWPTRKDPKSPVWNINVAVIYVKCRNVKISQKWLFIAIFLPWMAGNESKRTCLPLFSARDLGESFRKIGR